MNESNKFLQEKARDVWDVTAGLGRNFGIALKYYTRNTPVSPFIFLITIFGIMTLIFSTILNSIFPFIAFTIAFFLLLFYLMYLFPRKTDSFAEGQYWFDYQMQILGFGEKSKGLSLPNPEEKTFQPIIQTKTISGKANIIKPSKKI